MQKHQIHQNIFNSVTAIGRFAINLCCHVGDFSLFALKIAKNLKQKFFFKNFAEQLMEIGIFSLLLISITGFFSGSVLALQSYAGLKKFGAINSIPGIVGLSLTRELGPVLSALMLVSRVSSRIAAEIGGMRTTSQIIAMQFLRVNPIQFIIIPRILAATLMAPFLSLIFVLCGCMGGKLICTNLFGFSSTGFITSSLEVLKFSDLLNGLIKALVFGFFLSIIPCYFGYKTKGGAIQVGKSTTNSVVLSALLILLSNCLLTGLLFC